MVLGTATQRRTFLTSKWFFDNNVLEQVEDYTYLGINIHCSGSYKQILRVLHSKALRVYHGLFKSFSNIEKTPVKTLTKLFSTMVLPILLYNCEIWGPYLIGKTDSVDAFKNKIFKIYNDAEKLHLKFCKRILGVHLKSTNLAVYAELGRMPLSTQMCTRIAKFWLRIKSPKFDNTLVGKARDVCLDLYTKPVSFITHFLKSCGVKMKDFKSFNISQRELENFCHGLKGNLEEQYVRFWKDQIQQQENQGKLRTFKKFKTNLNFEEYLGDISNIKHRQAVTKLRISSHKLPVESGRYNNIPFDKRTCKLCNLNEVGNEQHYLMQCGNTLLKEIRYSFIQKLHQINSSFSLFNDQDLFLYIISMKDRSITKLVAKFCYDILAGFDHLQ